MSDNTLIPIAIGGLCIIAIIITLIIISHLLGKNITGYEVGVHLTPSGISPYCKCQYGSL